MPTYDYECDTCQHAFELYQTFSDPVKKKCPSCGRNSLRRLFGTGAALLFKGSGFYKTDYRSESYKKSAAADGKHSEKSSGDKAAGDKKAGAGSTETSKAAATATAKASS